MMSAPNRNEPRHPIRVVVRRTGLKPELIRAWERRYRAITPQRTAGRHRLYSDDDIHRLNLLRRATASGRSIGQIANLSDQALARLFEPTAGAANEADRAPETEDDPRLAACLEACHHLDGPGLARHLEQALVELGPGPTLAQLVVPMMHRIGQLWHDGRLRAMHEHLATSTVRAFLEQLIRRRQGNEHAPALVATTPIGQRHELGTLIAAAVAALEGWRVTAIGGDLPAEEIAAAVRETGALAVALGISYPAEDGRLGPELERLRRLLGHDTTLLVGGAAADAYSGWLDEVEALRLNDLAELAAELAKLRAAAHPSWRAGKRRPPSAGAGQRFRRQGTPTSGRRETSPPLAVGLSRAVDISRRLRAHLALGQEYLTADGRLLLDELPRVRALTWQLAQVQAGAAHPQLVPQSGLLWALGLSQELAQRVLLGYRSQCEPRLLTKALAWLHMGFGKVTVDRALAAYVELFGPAEGEPETPLRVADSAPVGREAEQTLERLWLLWLLNQNPVFDRVRDLFDDHELEEVTGYRRLIASLEELCQQEPTYGSEATSLFELLREPALRAPGSSSRQLEILADLEHRLAKYHANRLLIAADVLREEERPAFEAGGPPGPPPDVGFRGHGPGPDSSRPKAIRPPEAPWMAELVLVSKNVLVWLDQLSRIFDRPITRLDQVPDKALDELAEQGITGLWLVGMWQRSRASERIKQHSGHPEVTASAYALHDYRIADELGGDEALDELEGRARERGIRLGGDVVPNHMGIDSPWLAEHPEWFLSVSHSPFPSYRFTGENLSDDPRIEVRLEDHYTDQSDAAVVFELRHKGNGQKTGQSMRYVYHGNDGTSLPWNDTAQLDYLQPALREHMIEVLVGLAHRLPILRIDAAMTLVKQHVQRLWHPAPGQGGAIPSRAERGMSRQDLDQQMPREFWRQVFERLAEEAPDTLLVAEGFWMMEDYFVRHLGVHRIYNAAFLHKLRDEDNQGFRELLTQALADDPALLERMANFLTNPDEPPAAAALGKGDKYFALATLLVTLPGLPLFGHGQMEGLAEKYGMEYRRAEYTEAADPHFVRRHRREIVPLLERRSLFAHAAGLRLVDLVDDEGRVQDDGIALVQRHESQRALVVVNNRRAPLRGRLVGCRPYRTANGTLVEGESLARALGLGRKEPEWRALVFPPGENLPPQPFTSTFEELEDRGLEIELPPYGSRVFLDP